MPNRICPCGYSVPRGQKCPCQTKRTVERQRVNDAARGTPAQRGYDGRWAKESRSFLDSLGNPLCACGCGRPADMVDHKIAPKGDMRLFWDRANWQPYNQICNRRKAIRHEGALARR